MVEREKRRELADFLEAFISGALTNDEFVDEESEIRARQRPPRRERDRALEAVTSMAWYMYDDLSEHRLVDKHALTPEGLAEVRRWILFLRNDLEYEWPVDDFINVGGCLLNLITLGLWDCLLRKRFWRRMQATGDFEVWPFIRDVDYRQALARQASQS